MAKFTQKKVIKILAKVVSLISNPILILFIAVFGIGNKHQLHLSDIILVLPFFLTILGYIMFRVYIIKDGDFDLSQLKTRKYLGVSALIGLIISYLLTHTTYPELDYIFINAGLVIFITGWISIYWKISFHAIGFTTFILALYKEYTSPEILFLLLILPIIYWSRITLKKHTISQLVLGSIISLVILL